MIVESVEWGVRFEWTGEPSRNVNLVLIGPRDQCYERLETLQRTMMADGLTWTDEKAVERRSTLASVSSAIGLAWTGQFGTWEQAARCFVMLCRAVGLDDDTVELTVTP